MIGKTEIEKVIPHRGNMLMVDAIREYNDTSGVGIKYVRDDEFWCAGHFPGSPIMPGVLQVEALAQTAGFIILSNLGCPPGTLGYFASIDRIKFYHMVMPGDTLELHVEVLMKKMRIYKFHGIAMVGGKKVSEATFTTVLDTKQ